MTLQKFYYILLIFLITGCSNWSLNNKDKRIYDDELIEFATRLFEDDLEHFNYKFGD